MYMCAHTCVKRQRGKCLHRCSYTVTLKESKVHRIAAPVDTILCEWIKNTYVPRPGHEAYICTASNEHTRPENEAKIRTASDKHARPCKFVLQVTNTLGLGTRRKFVLQATNTQAWELGSYVPYCEWGKLVGTRTLQLAVNVVYVTIATIVICVTIATLWYP